MKMSLRLLDTVVPLLLAPLGAVVVAGIGVAVRDPTSILLIFFVYAFALAAGVVCVLPILVLVPPLRRPPFWLAAVWGVAAAWVFTLLLTRGDLSLLPGAGGLAELVLAGAASGIVYAAAARQRPRATEV
jgi:hypothetical protein